MMVVDIYTDVYVNKIVKAQGRPNLANGISLYVTDDPKG